MSEAVRRGRDAAGPGFAVQRSASAGEIVLALSGEFDLNGVERFDEAVADLPVQSRIRVDLAELDFLDSSGLRALMNLDVRNGGGEHVTLCAPQPHVLRLLEMCGFGERFEIAGG